MIAGVLCKLRHLSPEISPALLATGTHLPRVLTASLVNSVSFISFKSCSLKIKDKGFGAKVKNLSLRLLRYSVCSRLINILLSDTDKGRSSKKG